MNDRYGGAIWTNHALARLNERGISQSDAWYAFAHPQNSKRGNSPGAYVYYRYFKDTRLEVVAKQNELKEWVILSVWSENTGVVLPKSPKRPFIFRLLDIFRNKQR